jgi:predicted nucleic acid-binding protein
MVLVDSSVFINFFNSSKTKGAQQLSQLIIEGEDIAIIGIIVQEVLQGIKDDKHFKNIKLILDDFYYIPTPETIFLQSANLFRHLKKNGVTIRKSVDIIIAQTCINHKIPLLQADKDFVNIAKFSKLDLLGQL